MTLFEIFNSRLDIDWHSKAWGEQGGFMVNDIPYVVQLYKYAVPEAKGKEIMELSFHRADLTGDKTFSTTNDQTAPSAVYGVIFNALMEKTTYDGFYMSAERRHSGEDYDAKVSVYTNLCMRVSRRKGYIFYISQDEVRTEFLLIKAGELENSGRFVEFNQSMTESIDWNNVPNLKWKN